MSFRIAVTEIPEVKIIEPEIFTDDRGFFFEAYKYSEFAQLGIADKFVQVNRSKSAKGVLRGLHFQKYPRAQAKLVQVITGEVLDVAVDIRQGAPTFGRTVSISLSAENKRMLYIPAGFAHGYCVISEEAEMFYMTTVEYAPECEAGIRWNDPDLDIHWPFSEPKLSARDLVWPYLKNADNQFFYTVAKSNKDSQRP